ncbi:MAG TPA: peptidase, partial [Clostridiales bacterium]|nr:peptidase [Clostridiales bacterium]
MFNDNKCGKVLTAIGVSSMLLLSSTVYAASPLLRVGSRGNEVRQLQQSLKEVNVYNYKVTGYYGNITRDAVMKFQRQNGLAVDGIVGKKTLAALNGTYNTKSTQVSKNSRLLRRGSRGADVKDLQQKLKSKGYHKYSVDGIFGFRTEQSVKNFQ